MNVRKLALYACAGLMAFPLAANAASPMKAGKWKVTTQMEMPGMPVKMPPITVETCVTKEQAENPEKSVPDAGKDCKVADYKVDGNTVTWSVSCPKQSITGTGTITYAGDSYTGSMDMKMGEQSVSAKYSAKRTGDCEK
ncbi:MAG: hypothetical protein QOI24_4522 [Acidobacteriota bacterium]|jgi:hypothetical protein|nr:hypothetical protein [Acidobacteriota bacterium]